MNQPAQTAQNALSGEKTFETVRYAVTGNELADAVAGIEAVLAYSQLMHSAKSHILRMLAEVHQKYQEQADRLMQQPGYPPQDYANQQKAYDSMASAMSGIGQSAMSSQSIFGNATVAPEPIKPSFMP